MADRELRREQERKRCEKYELTQRVIMIARRNRGLTQQALADMLFVSGSTLHLWEKGGSKAPWDEIERVMPEVAEMREHGCIHYCDNANQCRESCVCAFRRRGRPKKV